MDPRQRRKVFLELAAHIWRFRARVLAAVALLVAAKLAAVAVPLVLKRVIDVLSRPEALQAAPVALLLGYALMRFASTLFTEMRDLVFARAAQNTVADFTLRIFDHLHTLSARFHTQRATGALIRDVERGTSGIAFLLGVGLFTIVPTLVEIGSVMAILLSGYAVQFSLILVATFVMYVAFTLLFTRRRSVHQRAINELDSNANRRLVDSLLNYETVRYYGNEPYEARRFGAIMREWIEAGVRNQGALTRLHVGQSAIIALGVGAVMLLAGHGVVAGTMTVGDLVLINAYVIQVCLPLNSLGFVFREASDAIVKADRVFELLAQRPEVDPAAGEPMPAGAGEIRYEGVSFGYEPARQVLHEVDFTIRPATTVAVVGGSGSGKSTLARLLLRFYDASAGRITIDGRDIRAIAPRTLRQSIGIVPQDTSLFNDTIAHNIGYGRIDATHEEIVAAARAANVHEFIDQLPQKYETMVGERGLKLSGGEKQRIAIARALLRNPPILVFDEATSALDTRSERAIQAELERLSRSRTTLVIAHRLSTVVNADEILVLEQGRIAERGRHNELLARRGLYWQMWTLQQQERELRLAERRVAMQPLNLSAIVAGVVDALRSEIDERRIHLYMTLALDVARVTGDPADLQRVAWDLVAHAIQHTERGGRMEVRLERIDGEARLLVTDLHKRPFTTVGQEDASDPHVLGTQRLFDSADLRRIVEDHEGRLTITRSDGGATYTVSMPLRAVDVPKAAAIDAAELRLDGFAIQVVDDNDDAREVLAAVLQAHGAKVTSYASGEEVIANLAALPQDEWPDLLVCDIGLPDIDGYSLLREIRAIEAARDTALGDRTPAIAVTGHARAEDRTRALLAGYQVHLAKPVDPSELLSNISFLLDHALPLRTQQRHSAHRTSSDGNKRA